MLNNGGQSLRGHGYLRFAATKAQDFDGIYPFRCGQHRRCCADQAITPHCVGRCKAAFPGGQNMADLGHRPGRGKGGSGGRGPCPGGTPLGIGLIVPGTKGRCTDSVGHRCCPPPAGGAPERVAKSTLSKPNKYGANVCTLDWDHGKNGCLYGHGKAYMSSGLCIGKGLGGRWPLFCNN